MAMLVASYSMHKCNPFLGCMRVSEVDLVWLQPYSSPHHHTCASATVLAPNETTCF